MSIAVLPTPISPPPAPTGPRPMKWTCEEMYRMSGIPSIRDKRLMLIEGEVLEMAFPGPLHDISLGMTDRWLRRTFPDSQFWIRIQMGLYFGINTDPVPDIAVVVGDPRNYAQHPRTAVLIVEIADTSIAFDTGHKASLYAAAGILDYWVIDVNDRRLHVFRDPQPDPAQKYGYGYKQVQVLNPKDTVNPLAAPNSSVAVCDLLP